MNTCQKCFKPNPAEATFCGFCGATIGQAAKKPGPEKKTVFGYVANFQDVAAAKAGSASPPADIATSSPSAAPQQSAPKLLDGRYQLGPVQHKVATGTYFQATDTSTKQVVSILIADNAQFASPLDVERARRELRQLQKAESDALLKVLDQGKTDDEQTFFVFESVPATTLRSLVDQHPSGMAPETAQYLIIQISNALAEAQKVGVVHRDISPDQIWLTSSRQIKVGGFALAPLVKRGVFGTAEFLSPEQAAGRPIDQRSNIYSVGALFFYLLTKRAPFVGTDVDALLQMHQDQDTPALSTVLPSSPVTQRIDALIAKATAKSSSRRHLTLRQFIRDIEALSGGNGEQAHEPTAPPIVAVPSVAPVVTPATPTIPASADPWAKTMIGASAESVAPQLHRPTVTPSAGAAIGEMGGSAANQVVLKPAEPVSAEHAAPVRKSAPPATAAQQQQPGFRETMWFFRGEVESAVRADGDVDAAAAQEEMSVDFMKKYADDGSLTDEEAKRLSLRTGKTQMLQAVKIPKGDLPGEKMAAEDFVGEMDRERRNKVLIGMGVAGAVVLILILWMVLS